MKRNRWIYRVYYANQIVGKFTSRATARNFMENMTEFDIPVLITPDIANHACKTPYIIGTLK